MSTDSQARFLDLAKKYEDLSAALADVREFMEQTMQELGIGTFVQDQETKVVYQVVKPKGSYVHYKDIDYIRTRNAAKGEKSGDLSLKKAEEAGFTL
jgi:hypothetical protein